MKTEDRKQRKAREMAEQNADLKRSRFCDAATEFVMAEIDIPGRSLGMTCGEVLAAFAVMTKAALDMIMAHVSPATTAGRNRKEEAE